MSIWRDRWYCDCGYDNYNRRHCFRCYKAKEKAFEKVEKIEKVEKVDKIIPDKVSPDMVLQKNKPEVTICVKGVSEITIRCVCAENLIGEQYNHINNK